MKVKTKLAEDVSLNRPFEVIGIAPGQSWHSGVEAASCMTMPQARAWIPKLKAMDVRRGNDRKYVIVHTNADDHWVRGPHLAGGCRGCA